MSDKKLISKKQETTTSSQSTTMDLLRKIEKLPLSLRKKLEEETEKMALKSEEVDYRHSKKCFDLSMIPRETCLSIINSVAQEKQTAMLVSSIRSLSYIIMCDRFVNCFPFSSTSYLFVVCSWVEFLKIHSLLPQNAKELKEKILNAKIPKDLAAQLKGTASEDPIKKQCEDIKKMMDEKFKIHRDKVRAEYKKEKPNKDVIQANTFSGEEYRKIYNMRIKALKKSELPKLTQELEKGLIQNTNLFRDLFTMHICDLFRQRKAHYIPFILALLHHIIHTRKSITFEAFDNIYCKAALSSHAWFHKHLKCYIEMRDLLPKYSYNPKRPEIAKLESHAKECLMFRDYLKKEVLQEHPLHNKKLY